MPKNRYLREINEQVSGATGGGASGTASSGGNTDHGRLAGLSDDDHPQYLTESRHGDIDAADHGSGTATDGYVLTADGAGGADWEDLPPLADHDHTGDAGDGGQLGVSALDSSGADAGDVPTANGTGGVVWAPQSGGGGGTPAVYTQYAEIVPLAVSTAQMGVAGVELRHGESDIAYGWWVVPGDWDGGNITIRPRGGAASAGDVRIGSNAVYRQRAGEANTLLATNNNVTLTVAAGEVADLPLITLPDTNIVAGDPLEVRIQRAGTHVDDSLANPLTMQEWVVSYTVGVTVAEGGTPDASAVTYTPTTATDWDSDADPGNVDDALDQLAERVDDLEGAGGGGGDSTYTAVYASRPAASNDGDLFVPSDGFVVERDTGAAWTAWGPLFPLTPPDITQFTWVNQDVATAAQVGSAIVIETPAASGDKLRILKKAAPATPYTITALVRAHGTTSNYPRSGILFRESATGKLTGIALRFGNVQYVKWNSATSYSGETSDVNYYSNGQPVWLRISDNGTNTKFEWSYDSYYWRTIKDEARGTFFTTGPDEVGFYTDANNSTYANAITLYSWKEE